MEYKSKRVCRYCGIDISDMDDKLYEKNGCTCELCASLLGINKEDGRDNDLLY